MYDNWIKSIKFFLMTSLFQVRLQVASLPDAVKIRKSFEVSGDVTL